jgi:uncharacterized membrane protein
VLTNEHIGGHMTTRRLDTFSDGVIAIVITIMVLELKVPHGDRFQDLQPLLPVFLSYVLSFLYVGIYWNNHHHMLHACTVVTAEMLWANLHLLFWLSLLPFATGWMGKTISLRCPPRFTVRYCSWPRSPTTYCNG